ncbi:MAG: tRNA 2-thiouridine(34) synthase MnmA, partial [Candidatus Dormibacteria bacterium]
MPQDAVIAVATSGGVDSSVAAARVADSGRRAFALTLAMWPSTQQQLRDRGCCSIDAVEDARRVAATLGLPHYVWNMEAEFAERVIRDFEDAYASARTPNPCVRCNERIKFGVLLERARAAGATHLATGHYARRGERDRTPTLHRAVDARRDQSYVLH